MVSSQTVFALTIACAFTFGLYIVLLSSMRHQLAVHLGLGERAVANLWAGMNCVLVPFAFLAGLAIDLGDVRWVILASSASLCLALLFLQSGGRQRARLAALLAAAGFAGIACAAMVLMPRAFFGSAEASASLNLGNVFFAFGALIAPALADVLLRSFGLKKSLVLLALAALVPGVLALLVPPQDVPAGEDVDLRILLGDSVVWLAAAVFFLYAPLEGSLHTWAESYLRGLGKQDRDIPRLIGAFWSFFLLGRLTIAFLQHQHWLPESSDPGEVERWMVCLMALGATVALGNLVGTVTGRGATFGLLMLGLFLGPLFPTLIGILFTRYNYGLGTLFGVVFAIGSAGSVIFAPLIAARMNRGLPQKALRIPLALSILLMVLTLVFALWHSDPPAAR